MEINSNTQCWLDREFERISYGPWDQFLRCPATRRVATLDDWREDFLKLSPLAWGGENFEDAGLEVVHWGDGEWLNASEVNSLIENFETESGLAFDLMGPLPTTCEWCGKLYQFVQDHNCEGMQIDCAASAAFEEMAYGSGE